MPRFSGNRGEWSEIYIFLKLMCDEKIYIADRNLAPLPNTFLTISKIVREEYAGEKYEYYTGETVRIFRNGRDTGEIIPISEFQNAKKLLWNVINTSERGNSLSCKEIEKFLGKIHISKLKAPAVQQNNFFGGTQDIVLQVRDYRTGIDSLVGFSCKSDFSSKSTLFNASKENTNFVYEVTGNVSDEMMERFNKTFVLQNKTNKDTGMTEYHQLIAIQERMHLLKEAECDIVYADTATQNTKRNLILSGGIEMPAIVAGMLKAYYFEGEGKSVNSSIDYALDYLVKNDIAHYGFDETKDIYRRKAGTLLYDMFTGMRMSKAWNGKSAVNGGYIFARNNGEVVAVHSCISEEFKEFLINNLRFESPSASRHGYMEMYKENGKHFLKLNMQIRFK